ncbi:MAG: anhydro-N-acetylmuramic acid kinase [Bryobacteraceae bacterium]
MRVAGIMSGTSLDGIDVAIVDIGARIRTVAYGTTPYTPSVRRAILAVSNRACHTADVSRLNFLLPELYAEALGKLCRTNGVDPASVELIGCHGQTIFHESEGGAVAGRRVASTLQIGDGSVLAERTGIAVVSDFRPRDMAAGGKGAPLVPFVDQLLFRHRTRRRVALNIGGIANITVLPAASEPGEVVAFDTGPGNMVMDQLVAQATQGRARFDRNGARAARGAPIAALLEQLLRDPYYAAPPPKTAGREQYGDAFLQRLLATGAPIDDLIASATAFTALTIVRGIRLIGADPAELIAAGGGVHNPRIMGLLAAYLPGVRVTTTDEFGIDPDAKEAIAFAILAHRTWRRKHGNLPSATGARHPVILGKISL